MTAETSLGKRITVTPKTSRKRLFIRKTVSNLEKKHEIRQMQKWGYHTFLYQEINRVQSLRAVNWVILFLRKSLNLI